MIEKRFNLGMKGSLIKSLLQRILPGGEIDASLSNKANVPQEITVAGDLYDYTTPGSYYCAWNSVAAQMQHMPPGLDTAFDLTVELGAEGTPVQTFKSAFDGHVYVNYKSYYDPVRGWVSDWTGWIKQATAADLTGKVTINAGEITSFNNATTAGRWTVAAPNTDPGRPFDYGATIYGYLDVRVHASGTWVFQEFGSSDATYKGVWRRQDINNMGWTPWEHSATATPPQEYDLPLEVGFAMVDARKNTFFKTQDNLCVVTFAVSGNIPTKTLTHIFTLPAGYRPSLNIQSNITCTAENGTSIVAGTLQVYKTGGVSVKAPIATDTASGQVIFIVEQ